jgi:hypothetical protein
VLCSNTVSQTQHFIASKIMLHEVATCFSPSGKTNTKYIKDGKIKMKEAVTLRTPFTSIMLLFS